MIEQSRSVAVLKVRQGQAALVATRAGGITLGSLHGVPSVILPASARRLHVHLLTVCLAHIRDVEICSPPVEAEAPGIPQAVVPQLATYTTGSHEGIVGRNGVSGATHVDPEQRAEQIIPFLAEPPGIAGVPAVPESHVENPSGPKTIMPPL